jgi:hypothetical protein
MTTTPANQPAAHAAFYTHWARLVSNMGHRPPHLGVLGAHVYHYLGRIPQAGQRAGPTRANFRVCFGPRSQLLYSFYRTRIGIGHT